MNKKLKKQKKQMAGVLIYPFSKTMFSFSKLICFFNFKTLTISLFILIISSLIFYIFQVTDLITAKYQIQNYQKEINKILQKNTESEISLAKINSLKEIDEKIKDLGFERTNKIYYIQMLEKSVARKDITKKE